MISYKNILTVVIALFIGVSCSDQQQDSAIRVETNEALYAAVESAQPGDIIILKNGVWQDVDLKIAAKGTKERPIVVTAETPGEVFIEGLSQIKFGGEYITVSGLHFRNGYTPSQAVIEFRIDKKNVANNCRFTNSVIEGFNQLQRDRQDHWVEFWGRHNQLDHCYIAGKSNRGPTVRVQLKGNESIYNFHQITNNYFGPRPRKGGPSAETLQIGDSGTSMSPSNTNVENNLFDRCNGEVEVISSKSNFNTFRNNVFYKSEGSLVTRHGNYCRIDGNFFIGDENSNNIGGVRIINTGHWVVNNYFLNLKGENFRSPLAVMNGIPKSPLNRYNQVTDIVVAHNTWVNCTSPWQFGVGSNIDQKEVLPASEIRSAVPVRSTLANNVIFNTGGDKQPVVAFDKIDGIDFKKNIISNNGVAFEELKGLTTASLNLVELNENIFSPNIEELADFEVYKGFDFETIEKDIFGQTRSQSNKVGAIVKVPTELKNILDRKDVGPDWYVEPGINKEPTTTQAASYEELIAQIESANAGDIIELTSASIIIPNSVSIDKKITIRSASADAKTILEYQGDPATPLFKLLPKGDLTVERISLEGNGSQYAFSNLKEDMSSLYNLKVDNSDISKFEYVLKAYKQTFADSVTFLSSTISNCANGIELSEETNDRGDYNVEFLTLKDCVFDNVKRNVIDYYRGGYDESTIGGNLLITGSKFTNCGGQEENKILLNHRGIINVNLKDNTFENNRVKFVSILWGAKNNIESNNTVKNSGELRTEENIKLTLMY